MDAKLIILRGPSGAGKSSIARRLQHESSAEVIIIEQDYYRHTVLADKPDDKQIVPKMVYTNAAIALEAGYVVIIEGIFGKEKYLPTFKALLQHAKETHIYYFDISFDETVIRHNTRSKRNLFDADEMRKWYYLAEPLGLKNEQIIHESMSEDETISLITQQTKLI